jgi:hypothetical protein
MDLLFLDQCCFGNTHSANRAGKISLPQNRRADDAEGRAACMDMCII